MMGPAPGTLPWVPSTALCPAPGHGVRIARGRRKLSKFQEGNAPRRQGKSRQAQKQAHAGLRASSNYVSALPYSRGYSQTTNL